MIDCDSCPVKLEVKRLVAELFYNNREYSENLKDIVGELERVKFERDFYKNNGKQK